MESRQNAVMGNPPEGDDRSQVRHGANGSDEELATIVDLRRQRLVVWRQAPDSVGDCRVDQPETVVRPGLISAGRESKVDQGSVKKVAGIVAGERSSGAIGSAQAGGETDDQDSGVEATKGRDRRVVPRWFRASPFLAKGDEAGTDRTVTVRIDGSQRGDQRTSSSSKSSSKLSSRGRSAWRCERSEGSRPT